MEVPQVRSNQNNGAYDMTCLFMPGTEEAAKLLETLESHALSDAPYPHWLCGDGYTGSSYCGPCAKAELAKQKSINRNAVKRKASKRVGFFVDGGWGSHEEDGCCHCETCGCLLAYVLTDYGVESELDHYSDTPFPPVSETEAYHIARIVWGAPTDERVLELARRAVAAIAKAKA